MTLYIKKNSLERKPYTKKTSLASNKENQLNMQFLIYTQV